MLLSLMLGLTPGGELTVTTVTNYRSTVALIHVVNRSYSFRVVATGNGSAARFQGTFDDLVVTQRPVEEDAGQNDEGGNMLPHDSHPAYQHTPLDLLQLMPEASY
jgi:hypothetical protein